MKRFKRTVPVILLALSTVGWIACGDDDDSVGEAFEEFEDEAQDAADEIEDEIDDRS